ncbi:hypothetical protein ACFCYN_04495 [Gottfriedia sp. NPDC056225]|uniref:hypothetical protein n=1 Tax=Gottfriedia sp. NPDC056225 TaxID=3345751 RepID=UPI0035E03CBE
MGRKSKENEMIQLDSLQIQFVSGFETEWAKTLASILCHQLKRRLEEGELQDEKNGDVH